MINYKRLEKDFINLSKFSKTKKCGITRYSYTCEDLMAKQYLIDEMKKIGLSIEIDNVGNIRGRMEGIEKNLLPIISGSHIDSVRNGGQYDGVLGVLGALEVARTIKENNIKQKRNFDILIFSEEEGSNFGLNLIGSKNIIKRFKNKELKTIFSENAKSMYEMIKYSEEKLKIEHSSEFYKAGFDTMVELHIEQGNFLEKNDKQIGIVEGIFGLRWFKVTIEGEANHAGATPMKFRKDPLVEASKIIYEIPNIVCDIDKINFVATVGQLSVIPNNINVIPDKVDFIIDVRSIDIKNIDTFYRELLLKIDKLNDRRYKAKVEELTRTDAKLFNKEVIDLLSKVAKTEKINYLKMYSGANHDTSVMSEIGKGIMIFVPSINGRSHCPEEETKKSDVEAGVNFLYKTLITLINK